MRTVLICLVAGACAITLVIKLTGSGSGLSEAEAAKRREDVRAELAATLEALHGTVDATRASTDLIDAVDSDAEVVCVSAVIPCFDYYTQSILNIQDVRERKKKLNEPATAILGMKPNEQLALGVASTAGLSMGSLFAETDADPSEFLPPGFAITGQIKLRESLMERWKQCADRNGEDLRGAVLQLFFRITAGGLINAEPDLLEMTCCFLGHYSLHQEDADVIVPPLLAALDGIAPNAEFDVTMLDPLCSVLATAAFRRDWVRDAVVHRLDAEWLEGHRSLWLMQLTIGSTYEVWREPLDRLIRTGTPDAQWGAVEGLRFFAASQENPLDATTVFRALPAELYESKKGSLRLAVIELVAMYGGDEGRIYLEALLADETYEYRQDVLSFLAFKGKLDGAICRALIGDEDPRVRNAAVHALGNLAKQGDPNAYDDLRRLARNDEDPAVRKEAVLSLADSGDPRVLADLKAAAEDTDPEVGAAAVYQIGVLREPQPELLLAYAKDPSRNANLRGIAYDEALLDIGDDEIPELFESMWRDEDSAIREKGYFWKGALAIATGDVEDLASWKALAPPSSILARVSNISDEQARSMFGEAATRVFSGTIQEKIEAVVIQQLERLQDPKLHESIAATNELTRLRKESGNDLLLADRFYAVERRILQYLASLEIE